MADHDAISGQLAEFLHHCRENGFEESAIEKIDSLLQAGANVNAVNQGGEGMLYVATDWEGEIDQTKGEEEKEKREKEREKEREIQLKVVQMLVEKGASLSAVTPDTFFGEGGYTPLHNAAFYGNFEICSFLLEKGAQIDGVSKNDIQTPLHAAVANGHLKVVTLFVENGANFCVTSFGGMNVLHWAIGNSHEKIVKYFLSLPDKEKIKQLIEGKDRNGMTPLSHAERVNSPAILKLLNEYN
eukprot:CAMPEP_0201479500 /NCGR_PEP_ID=MMETSP0151_2-20130828/4198_1 /ASSEMBLY_ACC=CAM_ASM_000257 /TAXON_ID=200890 /ORGANISM="Paramoeba atlantica, Strain 621/1 / CCAP 1560/9" /LENGTH=241 /DNA_ID=CAMNT_0047861027 /DNA_START=57 /DNA_END=782 /DNA_ORIENTATION=-